MGHDHQDQLTGLDRPSFLESDLAENHWRETETGARVGGSPRIQLWETDALPRILYRKGFLKGELNTYKLAAGAGREGSSLDLWHDSQKHCRIGSPGNQRLKQDLLTSKTHFHSLDLGPAASGHPWSSWQTQGPDTENARTVPTRGIKRHSRKMASTSFHLQNNNNNNYNKANTSWYCMSD